MSERCKAVSVAGTVRKEIPVILTAAIGIAMMFITSLKAASNSSRYLLIGTLAVTAVFGFYSVALARYVRLLSSRSRQVFLSYASSASPEAESIAKALRDAGARVWTGHENIKAGEPVATAIEKAIEDSDRFVVVLAEPPSDWQQREIKLARASHLRIIPVLVRGAKSPPNLEKFVAIDDFENNPGEALRRVVQVAT